MLSIIFTLCVIYFLIVLFINSFVISVKNIIIVNSPYYFFMWLTIIIINIYIAWLDVLFLTLQLRQTFFIPFYLLYLYFWQVFQVMPVCITGMVTYIMIIIN